MTSAEGGSVAQRWHTACTGRWEAETKCKEDAGGTRVKKGVGQGGETSGATCGAYNMHKMIRATNVLGNISRKNRNPKKYPKPKP